MIKLYNIVISKKDYKVLKKSFPYIFNKTTDKLNKIYRLEDYNLKCRDDQTDFVKLHDKDILLIKIKFPRCNLLEYRLWKDMVLRFLNNYVESHNTKTNF